METGRKKDFAKNTAIMTTASMVIKLIGLYLNIFLARNIGAEGMGLYGLIMSVYILASGISVSGMSVAVTRISSQELASGSESTCRGALRRCVFISAVLSLCAGIVMVCLSGVISVHWLKDANTANSLCVIALALLPVSVSAMLRGWYTARRKILMPSLSQLFEQAVRLFSCAALVPMLAKNTQSGCLALVISDVIAEYAGCGLLLIYYIFSEKSNSKEPENIGKRIADNALPITASHYLSSVMRTAESSLIPVSLVAYGMGRGDALSQLGIIYSMAVPLLLFPSAALTSAGSLLIPETVRYKALGQTENLRCTVEKAIGITIYCAVPASAVFLMFAEEWGLIFYDDGRLKLILTVLSPLVPLMYSEIICTSVLRGLGEQKSILKYNMADGTLRLLLIVLIVPRLGTSGVLIVIMVSNILTPIMCLVKLNKVTGAKRYFSALFKSVVYALCGAAVVFISRKALPGVSDKAGAVIFSVAYIMVYGILSLCSTRWLKEAVHRVCLQIPKAVRYISCRQDFSDAQAVRRAHRSH